MASASPYDNGSKLTAAHAARQDPTTVTDSHWISAIGPTRKELGCKIAGKWLIFRPFEKIDEMWRTIREKVESGELGSPEAKCSTLRYNPAGSGPGPAREAVICVYTTMATMDEVGMKLIPLVKNDIRYKTDIATLCGLYSHTSTQRTTTKTIYWNDGNPSFVWKGRSNRGPQPDLTKEDPWKLNQAKAPEPFVSEEVFGKWIVTIQDYTGDITNLWHLLKEMVESGELEAKEMVCPSRRNPRNRNELPEFHIFTSEARKESVGLKLMEEFFAEEDLRYEKIYPSIQRKAPKPIVAASEEEQGKCVTETDYDELYELNDKVKSRDLGAKEKLLIKHMILRKLKGKKLTNKSEKLMTKLMKKLN